MKVYIDLERSRYLTNEATTTSKKKMWKGKRPKQRPTRSSRGTSRGDIPEGKFMRNLPTLKEKY